MIYYIRGQIIELTSRWKRERFEGGGPRVPDYPLDKLRTMTIEETRLSLFLKDYKFQFEDKMRKLYGGLKLVGRAVTAVFMSTGPGLIEAVRTKRGVRGYQGTRNQRVVDHLQEGDVVVTDMFDRVWNSTFVGGSLITTVNVRTRAGGAVIWGGVCNIGQMQKIDTQVYYRRADLTPIKECLMTSYGGSVEIDKVVCMSGDIVTGTTSGILFIPTYLVEELVSSAEKSHAKNVFGFVMLEQGAHNMAEVDSMVWPEEMVNKTIDFIEHDSSCERYRRLGWSLEVDATRGDQEAVGELMKRHLV